MIQISRNLILKNVVSSNVRTGRGSSGRADRHCSLQEIMASSLSSVAVAQDFLNGFACPTHNLRCCRQQLKLANK